jgi:threonine/homoserine/homoserine lactone efflux protein
MRRLFSVVGPVMLKDAAFVFWLICPVQNLKIAHSPWPIVFAVVMVVVVWAFWIIHSCIGVAGVRFRVMDGFESILTDAVKASFIPIALMVSSWPVP